jgi:hypothetical protein
MKTKGERAVHEDENFILQAWADVRLEFARERAAQPRDARRKQGETVKRFAHRIKIPKPWVPSHATDIRKTFERVRAQMKVVPLIAARKKEQ